MGLADIGELDLAQMANWPRAAKILLITLLMGLCTAGFYYGVINQSLAKRESAFAQQQSLKGLFESKAALAAHLSDYQQQMLQLQQQLALQLKQLPDSQEVAALLDDISYIALDNGLVLHRISWLAQVKQSFTVELPMQIEVVGHYFQLGQFVAAMAALPRIVTISTLALQQEQNADALIRMSMLVKTYRYQGHAFASTTTAQAQLTTLNQETLPLVNMTVALRSGAPKVMP